MSLVSELQGLIEWLSDLKEAESPKTEETPLDKHGWDLVFDNMESAADKFGELATAIQSSPDMNLPKETSKRESADAKKWSPLADLARDLRRESQNLALRARVLAMRSGPGAELDEILRKIADAELTTANANRDAAIASRKSAEAIHARDRLELAEQEAESAGRLDEFRAEQAAEYDHSRQEAEQAGSRRGTATRAGDGVVTAKEIVRKAKAAETPIETAQRKLKALSRPDRVASSFFDELDALAESALDLAQRCEHAAHVTTQNENRDD